MSVLEQLTNNKGSVSSALGKELARQVFNGQMDILTECINLTCLEIKNKNKKHIRSGAAKVVEIVAEEKPEWVSPYLETILPALNAGEPQTRWMVFRTMGFCARLNKNIAEKAIPFAEKYLAEKTDGLCLASSADLFLGDYGAISKVDAATVLPILELSTENCIENEQDWLLEAFLRIVALVEKPERQPIFQFAEKWQYSSRKTTQDRSRKVLRFKAF